MIETGLLILAMFLYWPSRHGEFIYDDVILETDYRVRSADLEAIWKTGPWRRLTQMSYALNVKCTGYTYEP